MPSALDELLAVALPAGTADEQRVALRNALIERESQMQRRVGDWASLPNIRTPLVQSTVIAVGRLPEDTTAGKRRIIFLVLAPERGRSYHTVLSELVHELEDEDPATITQVADLVSLRRVVMQIFKGASQTASRQDSRWNRRFAKTAAHLADLTQCQVLLFFADTFSVPVALEKPKRGAFKVIVVSESNDDFFHETGERVESIAVHAFSTHRMSQLRAALFIGLMRGCINPADRVCCVAGREGSDKIDSLMVTDVAQEFPTMMVSRVNALIPAHVQPAVLERVIGIATDLAAEGREGKPIGTIFVLGDLEKITPYIEQLVMNPFGGYRNEDCNILNPFIEETLKEWAQIDGAFVINGDGLVYSAGSRLTAVDSQLSLLSGLGTRHAAAAAISSVADCAAICVSSSGQVTLFRYGEPIVLVERSASRSV